MICGRVLEILTGAKAKHCRNSVRVQEGDFVCQAQQIGDLRDPLEFRLEWFDPFEFYVLFSPYTNRKIRVFSRTVGELLLRRQPSRIP